MLNKIIHFIKYHNAFTIGVAVVFIIGASAFANEGVRDAVIGEKIVKESGIDNSRLLIADLNNFNFGLQITNIQEDAENYYIIYSHQTWIIKNNAWQPATKEGKMIVSKNSLNGGDLGLYLSEELGELVEYEIKYLKEVQGIENKKGLQQKVVSVDYTGLRGLALDIKNKTFPGYKPVVVKKSPAPENPVPQPESQSANISQMTNAPTPQIIVDRELIRQIVEELLAGREAISQQDIVQIKSAVASSSFQVSNVIISDVTTNTAKITWTTDKESSSIVEYGLSSGLPYDISISGSSTTDGNLFFHSVILTGLESGTIYHYRVVSVDKDNNRAEIKDRTFTTSSLAPIPKPEPSLQPEPTESSSAPAGATEDKPTPESASAETPQ